MDYNKDNLNKTFWFSELYKIVNFGFQRSKKW